MKRTRLEEVLVLSDSGTWGEPAKPGAGQPVLRSTNIQDGQLDLSEPAWVTVPSNDIERRRLADGDIIVTKSSGSPAHIGKCCIFRQPSDGTAYYFSNFTLRIRVNDDLADERYIFHWLNSGQGKAVLGSLNDTTSGLRNLSVPRYLSQSLPLPPLPEQRRIADILDRADALKRKRQQALQLADDFLRATFLDMFGDPATNPKNWPTRPFGECADNLDGQRVPVKEADRGERKGEFPYYGASGIIDWVDDFIFDGSYLLIGEDGANLLARSTPIAFQAHGQIWVNNHAHILEYNGICSLDFLEYFVNGIDLTRFVTGSAQPKLTQAALNRIKVPVPPVAKQETFSKMVESVKQLKSRLENSSSDSTAVGSSLQIHLLCSSDGVMT